MITFYLHIFTYKLYNISQDRLLYASVKTKIEKVKTKIILGSAKASQVLLGTAVLVGLSPNREERTPGCPLKSFHDPEQAYLTSHRWPQLKFQEAELKPLPHCWENQIMVKTFQASHTDLLEPCPETLPLLVCSCWDFPFPPH